MSQILYCAKFVCLHCIDKEFDSECEIISRNSCDECETKFFNTNSEFGEWLFSTKKTLCIAHNSRSFDGVLMLEYILETMNSSDKLPKVLLNGSKIISLEFRNLKFIDSLSFLPMPLNKFTKTFDLKELKKGFFPHKFNLSKNQTYIGSIPGKGFYEFEIFYNENKNKIFN
jgi:hypothetical protein